MIDTTDNNDNNNNNNNNIWMMKEIASKKLNLIYIIYIYIDIRHYTLALYAKIGLEPPKEPPKRTMYLQIESLRHAIFLSLWVGYIKTAIS